MEVSHFEQRAYIKIALLRGRNAMKSHSKLAEAVGSNVVPLCTVLWIGKFQQGRLSTSDEKLSGRLVSVRTYLAYSLFEFDG